MIGQIIGTYRIEQKIGEGGMGAVYRGRDLMLEREVAIKALRPELARQPELVARFRSEAVTLAKLNHSHIATLYNFLRHGEDYFMVMEFVRGNTLDEVIQQAGALEIEHAVRLFCQALEGIAHAHALGVIHRDIKPANLMLTANDEVKVMDFGIARVLGSARQTKTGRLIGTLEYMSPEQMRGQETDERSDIYALGILLYEMLTGRVPFQANSDYELMRAQVEDDPIPPRECKDEIPLAIETAILQALAKDPATRFQSAAEFRTALINVVPTAALKSASIKATRQVVNLAEAAIEEPSFNGSQPDGLSPSAPLSNSGFDRTTGTFTLKVPAFLLTARQQLEARVGPLSWKHYGGAAAAMLALVVGLSALRGDEVPPPVPKPQQQAVAAPTATPVVIEPLPTKPLRLSELPLATANPQPVGLPRLSTATLLKTLPTATPKPLRPQSASNQKPEPFYKPTPTPTPTPQAKPGKLEKTLDVVGKGAEAAGKTKEAIEKFNPFRRKKQ